MILYGDPRRWAKNVLANDSRTENIHVYGTLPTQYGLPAVWLAMDGGQTMHIRESVFMRVNVFAETDDESYNLAALCEALWLSRIDGDPVVFMERAGGPNLIDDGGMSDVYSLYRLVCRPREV